MNKQVETCTCCGKRIVKGRPIYKIPGLIFRCCSASCLLYSYTNYTVETSTGYVKEDEE